MEEKIRPALRLTLEKEERFFGPGVAGGTGDGFFSGLDFA